MGHALICPLLLYSQMTQPDFRALLADNAYAASFQSLGQYRTALLKALDATPPPEPPPTPDLSALAAIGERLRTQDNRCTAHPAFQVRGLRRIYGMDPDYTDDTIWLDTGCDYIEVDPPEDPENPGDFLVKTGYQDHWEIIMVAFSEQACLDYIKHNGHRHRVYRELEVYADSFYRCPEMLAIREALMALPGESTPPPEPPTELPPLLAAALKLREENDLSRLFMPNLLYRRSRPNR